MSGYHSWAPSPTDVHTDIPLPDGGTVALVTRVLRSSLIGAYTDWRFTDRLGRDVYDAVKQTPEFSAAMASMDRALADAQADDADKAARAAAIVQVWDDQAARAAEFGQALFVRFGTLPPGGRSWNHRDNEPECGVSVYQGWELPDGELVIDMRRVDDISGAFIVEDNRPLYHITGTQCGTGSDGEPVIADAAAHLIKASTITYIGAPYAQFATQ